jgi:hypothetical protein
MKGSRVYLRIEEEVKEKWVIAAKKRGLTLSDYVRTLVDPEEGVKNEKVELEVKNEVTPPESITYSTGSFKTYFK